MIETLAEALTDQQNELVFTGILLLLGMMIAWFFVETAKALITRVQGQHEYAYHCDTFADDYLRQRDPHSYDDVRRALLAARRNRRRKA